MPRAVGNFANLRVLKLDDNLLRGELPSELANLNFLEVLDLSKNDLSGELPSELGNLEFLRVLDLYENGFSGSLPHEWGNLTSLEHLSIGDTLLSGCLPGSLKAQMPYLELPACGNISAEDGETESDEIEYSPSRSDTSEAFGTAEPPVITPTGAAPSSTATGKVQTSLTAQFLDFPESHDGRTDFIFELRFGEEFQLSYKTLRDHSFTVGGGEIAGARRLERPGNIRWEIAVRPDGKGAVTVVLAETTDCTVQGAICTGDGRKLSTRNELSVSGPN